VSDAPLSERAVRIQARDPAALASLMRELEAGRPEAVTELGQLARACGLSAPGRGPLVVGLTGPPGSGKSTLVDALLGHWRGGGGGGGARPVGVIAVDPSSPVHGGAILGDRVRMQRHATDPGVFVRSVASRGASGGLARVVHDLIAVLGCGGFELVLVETVGVGQSEVDVTREADVTVVVLVPGLGDTIQAMKAGVLELADVLVVNKADLPGADAAVANLRAMLELRHASGPPGGQADANTVREVPILETRALAGDGIRELAAAIEAVGAARVPLRSERRRRGARDAIVLAATRRLAAELEARLDAGGPEALGMLDDVAERRRSAIEVAEGLMAAVRRQY
jgi:LAO/AO transport system kinase